jgi:hypothetical protein
LERVSKKISLSMPSVFEKYYKSLVIIITEALGNKVKNFQ